MSLCCLSFRCGLDHSDMSLTSDFSVRGTFLYVSFNANVELLYSIVGYVRAAELGQTSFALVIISPYFPLLALAWSLNNPRRSHHHVGNGRDEPNVWAQPEKGGPW